jgi:hypothetical protein
VASSVVPENRNVSRSRPRIGCGFTLTRTTSLAVSNPSLPQASVLVLSATVQLALPGIVYSA